MLLMFDSPSFSSTFFAVVRGLVASASISFVAAQKVTTNELYDNIAPTAPLPGYNDEGTSVFTNFVRAYNDKQLFFIQTGRDISEKPESDSQHLRFLNWCSDLTFSDFRSNSSILGYAGRGVGMFLTANADAVASGAQFSAEGFSFTSGISAVYSEQQNVFQGQYHVDTDDLAIHYLDSGRKAIPMIGWEGHDEGDVSPNAATASWSAFGEFIWTSAEEVAQLFNISADEFTPENFNKIYKYTWIKTHEEEVATDNPLPGDELEIIEQMKNETNTDAAAKNAAPVQPVEDDPSGNKRKLASVAAKFVSAALRVLGI